MICRGNRSYRTSARGVLTIWRPRSHPPPRVFCNHACDRVQIPSKVLGCLRFTKLCWGWKTYKHYYETDELSNPRPTKPKKKKVKGGIWATLFFAHRIFFFGGLGLLLYRKQSTRIPTQPNSWQTPWSINQSINQWISQPTNNPINRPTTLTSSQPQSTNKRIDQFSIHQPINQQNGWTSGEKIRDVCFLFFFCAIDRYGT